MPPEQTEQPTFQFDGFRFERISLETLARVPRSEGETLGPVLLANLQPRGGIEIDHDNGRAEVALGFTITPDPKKQPYVIIVDIIGRFSLKTGTIEHLIDFAKGGAASVLFPYVRQMIHTLTRDGKWGPLLIDPINVQTMLKWQDNPATENLTDASEPLPPPPQLPSDEPGSGS